MSRCVIPVSTPFATRSLPCGVVGCSVEAWAHEDWLSHMQSYAESFTDLIPGTAAFHEARWSRAGLKFS